MCTLNRIVTSKGRSTVIGGLDDLVTGFLASCCLDSSVFGDMSSCAQHFTNQDTLKWRENYL